MTVEGKPDLWYGYLDAAFDPLSINMRDGNVFMLGFLNYINDRRFVALMPGVRWLPATGADIGRGDVEVIHKDGVVRTRAKRTYSEFPLNRTQ